jgi:hypothetical protein
MSALSENTPLNRTSSRHSVEIIDVDQFEDLPVASSSTTRTMNRQPANRHPETIEVLDSDEDDEIHIIPGRGYLAINCYSILSRFTKQSQGANDIE